MNDPLVAIVVFVIIGIVGIGPLVVLAIAATARMRGKRSRFDRVAELFARGTAAGVFPPSARGAPGVIATPEIEDLNIKPADPAADPIDPRLDEEWQRSRTGKHRT